MPNQGSTESPKGSRYRLIRIEPSPRAILTLLLLMASLWVLYKLLPVVLVLVAALIIVDTVNPAVRWLEERQIRRGMGIALVFSALTLVTISFITLTIPALMTQVSALLGEEPALRGRLASWLAESPLTTPLAELLLKVRMDDLFKMAASNVIEISTRAIKIIAYIMSSLFLALYIMIDRDRLRGSIFLAVPRSHHIRLSRILLNMENIVGAYIRGQVITCAFMGAFVFILLSACKVENALAIAVFAGVADVLPYIGPLLSVGAAVGACLSSGPTIIIIVLVLMLSYEEFESRVIIPRIYGRALRLPSSVILFSLLAGTVLLGIVGALLALPVAAAVRMLIEELRVELPGQQKQAKDVETQADDELYEEEYEHQTEGMPAEQAAAIAVKISAERSKKEHRPTTKRQN